MTFNNKLLLEFTKEKFTLSTKTNKHLLASGLKKKPTPYDRINYNPQATHTPIQRDHSIQLPMQGKQCTLGIVVFLFEVKRGIKEKKQDCT